MAFARGVGEYGSIIFIAAIGALGTYGRDPQWIERSRSIVEQYMRDPNSVDAAMAGNALSIAALQGNADLYDKYMARMKTAKTPEEYYNYFGALGQFPSAELAKRTFEFGLGPDVKNQDLYILVGPLENVNTQAVAWELFKSNFKAIMGKADASLGESMADVAGVFCDGKLAGRRARVFCQPKHSRDGTSPAERQRSSECVHRSSFAATNEPLGIFEEGGCEGRRGAQSLKEESLARIEALLLTGAIHLGPASHDPPQQNT